jgi:translation initiation factor IF-2
MAVAPHVQFMHPRHPMPAYDGSTAGAKPPVGSSDVSPDASSDALIAPIAAGAAPTSVEVQQPQQPQQAPENGNKPGASVQTAQVPAAPAPSGTFLNPSNPPVAVPKTGQGAFEPAQHQPMEQAAREVRAEEVGAGAPAATQEKAPAVKVAAKSADASSDVPAKQEGPKSWAQMASKPPQLQAAARAVAAVVAATARGAPATPAADGHSENSGGASVADASRDDVSKGEGGEQRAGHRRETGRGDGTRKDSLAAAERGGGRGKGGNVGSGGGASGGREGGGGRGEGGGRGGDSSWKGRPGGGAGRVAAN